MQFKKATRRRLRLRIALNGPTGSGKTYSALAIGCELGEQVAVIDTEHGSASLYSDRFEFEVVELEDYAPRNYIRALRLAAENGFPVVIIDSLSHAWFGEGGILDQKDHAKGNKFTAWKDLTPQQNQLIESILTYPGHVLVTMRTKTHYDVSEGGAPKKVGLAPVQRDGVEYEFDLILDMQGATATVSKTRFAELHKRQFKRPGKALADELKDCIKAGGSEDRRRAKPRQEAPPLSGHQEHDPRDDDLRPRPAPAQSREPQRIAPNTIRSIGDAQELFPELGPDYVLEVGDYCSTYRLKGNDFDHTGLCLVDAIQWQHAASHLFGRKDWKSAPQRHRALILWANELRQQRKQDEKVEKEKALERHRALILWANELRQQRKQDEKVEKEKALERYIALDIAEPDRKAACKRLGLPVRHAAHNHEAAELEKIMADFNSRGTGGDDEVTDPGEVERLLEDDDGPLPEGNFTDDEGNEYRTARVSIGPGGAEELPGSGKTYEPRGETYDGVEPGHGRGLESNDAKG